MATYYVAQNGSNSNSGLSISSPKLTIAAGVGLLNPGDTLYIRSGNWNEVIDLQTPNKTGNVNNWITIAGYPGETVTIQGTDNLDPGYGAIKCRGNISYVIFDNLILDGSLALNSSRSGWALRDGNHHIIIRNLEIKNFKNVSGIYISANDITIQNCKLHDQLSTLLTAGTYHYGIYFHDGDRVIIEGCDLYNNDGGGMQLYPGPISNATIRNNRFHDNNRSSNIHIGGVELLAAEGHISDFKFYNNLFYKNGSHINSGLSSGLELGGTTSFLAFNLKVWNNTFFGNKNYGIVVSSVGLSGSNEIRNNIIYSNLQGTISNGSPGVFTVSNNITANPLFVDSSNNNYQIQSGSPAMNAGIAISEVTTDILGSLRGNPPEAGAYEFISQLRSNTSSLLSSGSLSLLKITGGSESVAPLPPTFLSAI